MHNSKVRRNRNRTNLPVVSNRPPVYKMTEHRRNIIAISMNPVMIQDIKSEDFFKPIVCIN